MYNSLAKELTTFFLDWDAPSYVFHRPVLDSKPYQIVKKEDRSVIVFNALGVSKNDIKVEVNREHGTDWLTINAETKNSVLDKLYSVSGRFALDSERVKEISWVAKDGLLEISVFKKEPEKSKIKITAE